MRRLPDDVLAQLKLISDEKVAELVGDDELSIRIFRSYENFRKGVIAYNEYSERAFMNIRAELEGY